MNPEIMHFTDAQLKALSLKYEIRPGLLCALPPFCAVEPALPPVLDEAQEVALNIALRPLNVTDAAVLLANDGLMYMRLSMRGELGVLTGREDDANALLPCEAGDFATTVMAHLARGGEPLKRAAALDISPNAFLLLLAAADAYKIQYLEDLLSHSVADVKLTTDALERAVGEAYENADLRWLLPFALFRMEQIPWLDIQSALDELSELGVLEPDSLTFTGDGELFVDDLMFRSGVADVSSVYMQGEALARSHVLFIRTLNTLWGVRFGDGDVSILSLTIDEACEMMAAMLTQKDEPGDREEPATETEREAKAQQTVARPTSKFCHNCGSKLSATAAFCGNCGTKLG
jgi:hypothetical protein